MKALLSVLMIYTLSFTPCLAAGAGLPGGDTKASEQVKPSVKETALAIPAGKRIEVLMQNKEKVVGKLGVVTNDTLEVRVTTAGKGESRQLNFSDVKSIKEIHSHKTMWIVIACLAGVFVVMSGIILSHDD